MEKVLWNGSKHETFDDRKEKIPEEFELAKDFAEKGFITTSSDNLINWARQDHFIG